MDDFFTKTKCDKCGGSLERGRTMSMFNLDCLCRHCKSNERNMPGYKEAVATELEAVKNKNYNFPGVGLK